MPMKKRRAATNEPEEVAATYGSYDKRPQYYVPGTLLRLNPGWKRSDIPGGVVIIVGVKDRIVDPIITGAYTIYHALTSSGKMIPLDIWDNAKRDDVWEVVSSS